MKSFELCNNNIIIIDKTNIKLINNNNNKIYTGLFKLSD